MSEILVPVKLGEKVPDFKATAVDKGQIRTINLSDYRGKWVVLFFYTLDFTGVCQSEIGAFHSKLRQFSYLNAAVIGASADSEHSHRAWFSRAFPELDYPVIADTTHKVSRLFGVLKEDKGVAFRATFIIDPDGFLRHQTVSDLPVGRSVEETLRVLQALQTGDLCPAEWKPGEKTLGKA